MKRCFHFPTCGYYEGKTYYAGVPLYQRERDGSFFIIKDGKRIDVGIVNKHGTVVMLSKGGADMTKIIVDRALLDRVLELCESTCGGRCNAEYNPCEAREEADALRAALAASPAITVREPLTDEQLVNEATKGGV